MTIETSKQLNDRVLEFIRQQPGYNENTVDQLTIIKEPSWIIIYGDSIQAGITGTGDTPEGAYKDFLVKWASFDGFKWLNTMKSLVK